MMEPYALNVGSLLDRVNEVERVLGEPAVVRFLDDDVRSVIDYCLREGLCREVLHYEDHWSRPEVCLTTKPRYPEANE